MRWLYYTISVASSSLVFIIYQFWPPIIYALFIIVPYILIGIHDIMSVSHTVLRNYPVVGHLRYILEYIRPEIQQYYIETDSSGAPYSREIRSLVYQKAKGFRETIVFGTKNDLTSVGYVFSYHSIAPKVVSYDQTRIVIGGADCAKPYDASRLNISGMSFVAISPNAIRALNKGEKIGNFAHSTGGGVSSYNLENGGDIIWQIGTAYFGYRHQDGRFNQDAFEQIVKNDVIKMIEIKLSQGAKPAHGGILPAAKVNAEIAKIRMLEPGKDAISPPNHSEFSTPIGMMEFIARLRKLSGRKPIGFKLCLGHKTEFMAYVKL